MANLGWKFMGERDGVLVSLWDKSPWIRVGEWREVPPPTETCGGLNCSHTISDAWSWLGGGTVLARVEWSGESVKVPRKRTCQRMRVLRAWRVDTAPAWAKYEKVRDAAWAEYEKVRDAARAEYEKVCDAARAEYEKVYNAARADLGRAIRKQTRRRPDWDF